MKTEEIESLVEAVTQNAFNVVKSAYDFQKESRHASAPKDAGTRILFPKYGEHRKSGEVDRISEQELRFVFVEQLNKYLDEKGISGIYYSVETPTVHSYSMKEKSVDEENGRSGNTDLTLHTIHDGEFERVCIIEFKALNPDEDGYAKDIIKLKNEDCPLKYFIQIVKNANGGTIASLKEKTLAIKESGIRYLCYCLDKGERLEDVEWR